MDEALINDSEITPIQLDDDKNLLTFAKGLCKIQIGKYIGSGFLCGFNCGSKGYARGMFTCHHVLNQEQEYFMTRDGCRIQITGDQVEWFWTNDKIDVTFFCFKREFAYSLRDYGWYYFAVAEEEVSVGSHVKILQHPEGREASVSIGAIIECSNDEVRHTASTLCGSSGSPLIDKDYRVFGIHKAGGPLLDKGDPNQGAQFNIGKRIRCAIDDMSGKSEDKLISSTSKDSATQTESHLPAAESTQWTSTDSATPPNRGVQLFHYSAGARRRAEVEKFGGLKCILCSASGLFTVGTGELGGGLDWSDRWRRMVGGSRGGLGWFLMMPKPVDNLVVWMRLVRRDDTLLVQTEYQKDSQRGNAPPQFTIDCEVTLIMENLDGTSTNSTQQKQHKITLVDDFGSLSDLLTCPVRNWGVVNPHKPPILKIQLINVKQ